MKVKLLEKLNLQLFAANDEPGDSDQADVNDSVIEGADIETGTEDITNSDENIDDLVEEDEHVNTDAEDSNKDVLEEDKPFKIFGSQEEYQSHMDDIIGKRLKQQRVTQEKLDERVVDYENVINTISNHFGVKDFNELKKYVDDNLIEDIAFKRGISKEEYVEQQKQLQKIKNFEMQQQTQMQFQFENAVKKDVEKLKKYDDYLYGDIDADALMNNQQFIVLLGQGLGFKKAYDALYIDDLTKKAAEKAKKNTIDNIKAKGTRIKENVAASSKAGIVKVDVNKLDDKQLAELEERAARGEKIFLN